MVKNHYDDRTPLVFTKDQLSNNPEFVSLFKDSLYEEVRVPAKAPDPYVTVNVVEVGVIQYAGAPEYVAKVQAEASIYVVRKYPEGRGSEMDFGPAMKVLRAAMSGMICQEVELDGQRIGTVTESTFLHKLNLISYNDGTFDVLKKGICVRIIYLG